MIAVDTSVWVDVLNGVDNAKARRCIELVEDGAPVALTEIVLTELLQGFRSDREAARVEKQFRAFPILRLEAIDDFVLAAHLYREARACGITIRKTLDCLIAAPCVRTGVPILHADEDFNRLASCTALQVFE